MIRPISDQNNGHNKVLGVATDITKLKLAEEHIEKQLQNLDALRSIDISIASTLELRLILKSLVKQAQTLLSVDAAAIVLLNQQNSRFDYVVSEGFCHTLPKNIHPKYMDVFASRLNSHSEIIHREDFAPVDFRDSFPFLNNEKFITYLGVPLNAKGKVVGVLEVFHRSHLEKNEEWVAFLNALAGTAAIAIDNANLLTELRNSNINLILAYDATIEGWARALEMRDMETEGHSQRVTDMSLILAVKMGVRGDDLVYIRRGALLHDIGKMGIPDAILNKPGKLSEDEWVMMRKHPLFASDMLKPIEFLQPSLDIPRYHHEKWDGSGYPFGIKSKEIPLPARIFSIVDVWDSLIHARPYKPAWPEIEALKFIREQKGVHFDPVIVERFLNLF